MADSPGLATSSRFVRVEFYSESDNGLVLRGYNMSGQSLSLALEEEAKLLNLLEDEIEADSQTQIAAHEIRTLLIKEKNQ